MKFARRQQQATDINLTPLIDVVFILLIFFMVSTTYTRPPLLLDLPVSSLLSGPGRASQVEIAITSEGNYLVNGMPLADREVATLGAAIEAASGDNRPSHLMISADAASSHQAVVTVMSLAKEMGFTQLQLSTRPSD